MHNYLKELEFSTLKTFYFVLLAKGKLLNFFTISTLVLI